MAKVGAQRAAVLTGRSKSTVQRAMNSGKLSYEVDANGRRVIDVSELERVFGIKTQSPSSQALQLAETEDDDNMETGSGSSAIAVAVERERMAMQIKMLEQQLLTASENIDDLKQQRDKWERQATQILITSQYTQKQAEELRTQLKEREEKAKMRRLQYEERLAQHMIDDKRRPPQGNLLRSSGGDDFRSPQRSTQQPQSRSREAEKLDEHMKKLKADNQNASGSGSSVFRFWKKVIG